MVDIVETDAAGQALAQTARIDDYLTLFCDDGPGFVFAQVTSKAHAKLSVARQGDKDVQNANLPDIHAATFQVMGPTKYKAIKSLRKVQKKLSKKPADEYTPEEHKALAKEMQRLRIETEENKQERARQSGKAIVYGQIIQMQHTLSKCFLAVSTTQTSTLEPSNMQLDLAEDVSRKSQFRVLPRYKVRSVGDQVRVGDQIQLESVKTEGQFLHCSRSSFGAQYVESNSRELNLSATQSALTIHMQFSPFGKVNVERMLRGGSVIRLFHRELEAYLTAEGSFYLDEPTQDVHLRVRPQVQERPRSLEPPSSGITYWQVELDENPTSGSLIQWGQRVRLKHMATRKYLGLVTLESEPGTKERYQLTLSDCETKTERLQSAFRLHPVIQEAGAVKLESYCRIDHPRSKQWLHALPDSAPDSEVRRTESKASSQTDSMSLTGLQWDKAKLRKIHVSEEMNYNDAFTLQEVTPDFADKFNFVAGMVPIIRDFRDKLRKGVQLNAKVSDRFKKLLEQLSNFQVVNGEPVKDHQKLLRNLQVIDILVEILKLHGMSFIVQAGGKDHLGDVCAEIYNCLETYLLGNSRKNELYAAGYIPFFQSQIGKGLNAERMAMELARDNRDIIDRLPHSQIDSFVKLLMERKDGRYLDFLGVLCVCDGIAIPENQVYICQKLLEEHKDSKIVYLTEPTKDKKRMEVSVDGGASWKPLAKFASKGGDDERNPYIYLEHQLDLFGKMCYGRNEYVIDVITNKLRYLTWAEVFICLKDEDLPDHLRAKYCELIVGMFVDVSPNYSALETLELSFIFNEVREEPAGDSIQVADQSITGATLPFFPELRKWIASFMAKNTDMTASNIGENELLGEVFRLLYYLVSFGYYSAATDIEELLKPLLGVLDGRNDKPFDKARGDPLKDFRQRGRYEQSPQNKAIIDAKFRAMEVLDVFFNFGFNVRLESLIYEFKATVEGMNRDGPSGPTSSFHHLQSKIKGGLTSVRMGGNVGIDPRYNVAGVGDSSDGIVQILMGRASDETIFSSDALDYARYRLQEHVFKKVRLFRGTNLEKILLDLGEYQYDKMVVKSVYLLDRYYSTHATLFEKAVQGQVLITDSSVETFKRVRKLVPELRRLTTAKLTPDMETRMSEIITVLSNYCSLSRRVSGEQTEEPHPMNQKILLNFGIVDDIFNVLDKRIDVKLIDTQYAGLRAIFQKCFCFLQVMARANAPVQERIFERMDKLLEVPGCPQELGICMAEVFTGNQSLCLAIKPAQVKHIVELVATHREEGSELLEALNAIVKVEELDLPLKRNQAAVVTYINQNRSRVAWILEPGKKRDRMDLLHDGQESNAMLVYLVKLVDVLATCAEGENRFIESMCQNIFSLEEIIEVINDEVIPIWCKRPYLRFFVWCYLNTAGGPIESGCGDLDHDDEMWRFMASSRDTLKSLCHGFNSFNRSRAADLRQTMQRRRGTTSAKSRVAAEKSKEVTLSTPGVLKYVFEGLLPFLQVFYSSFFKPDSRLSKYDNEIQTSQLIAVPLLTLYDSITTVISNVNQYTLLKSTIATIISFTEITVPEQLVTKFERDAFQVSPDLRSDAQKEYTEDFFEEEDLNSRLNLFVGNFETAYEGRNTLREQINEPYDMAYSEDGGDEDLPRGREFQRFLLLFQDGDGVSEQHVSKLIGHIYISFHSPEYRSVSSVERIALDNVNVKCLQLLRALIHNKVVTRAALELTGGTTAAIQRYDTMIDEVQRQINGHGTTEKVVPMLSHPCDEVVRETLALLGLLVFNAQKDVQMSFVDYCLGTREEQFFRDLELRLARSTVALRERRALQSQFQAKLEKDKELAKSVRARTTTAKGEGQTMLRAGGARNEFEMQEIMRQEEGTERDTSAEDGISVTKDDGYIELVLRIIGGLCNGQQHTIQNYLREQPDNIKSINLVAATVDYLQLFKDDVNVDNVELVVQLLQTLVEFTGGNTDNQACVFDAQVIEALNSIMRTDWKNIEMLVAVMGPVTDLLRNMVELSVPATKALAQLVGDTIHYESLYVCLEEVHKHRHDPDPMVNVVGYRIVHFLMRLNDFQPKTRKWTGMPDFRSIQNKHSEDWEAAWKYYCKATLSVEVLHADALQRVYFAAEFQDDLREEVKEQLKWNIQRDSAANKLRDFLKWSEDIREDMEYQGQLTRNKIASFFVKNSRWWAIGMLLLTFILNIFMLATWDAPVHLWEELPETPSYYNLVIYVLGSIHLFFAVCVAITFFIANLKNFTVPGVINHIVYKFTNYSFNGSGDIEKHNQLNIVGLASIYHLCLVGFSAASIPFKGYFFCFHLLHIVVNNDTLTRVLQSVIRPGRQLIYVTILALFIIYIYAVASFAALRIFFDRDEGLFCETLGECYATSIRFGLLATLGDVIPGHNYTFQAVGIRVLFDLTFFIVITTIGLNIVFGLIVDSFSSLRDEKNDALEDMSSVCFMCSLSSHEFDKYAQGFEHHVKHDHNMWSYLFYFIFLHKLEANDMTATEDFVFRKLKAQDIDFFPTNKALCLENVEVGNEEQLDNLKEMVARLVHRIEREEDEERRKKARDEQRQWEKRAQTFDAEDRRASGVSYSGHRKTSGATGATGASPPALRLIDDVLEDEDDDDEHRHGV
eukprot:scpid3078/ scgid34229/ Inositol 1,4,5-trisphosphate receptor type 1; IP3 receptor isoform 1; Type 1 inositol 1,4,5-trisphosphate receptor